MSVNLSSILIKSCSTRFLTPCIVGRSLLVATTNDVYSKRFLKSPVPIKWIRPEKVLCYKPEKSGDLKPLIKINKTDVPLEFRDCEELKTADENVKRLFTLEFFPYKKTVDLIRKEYSDIVKRHALDTLSPEARVARMTANIRDMQRMVEKYPRDKKSIVRLKETIDKRKKLLKFLRQWDYKCYEWILEKLDLEFKPTPDFDIYKRVERKRSLRMLTKEYCENIINTKLEKYKKEMEDQQESFLEHKISSLKWIIEEELACNVKPTVSTTDIEEAQRKLDLLRNSRKKSDTLDLGL